MSRLDWLTEMSAVRSDDCIIWPDVWAVNDGYGQIKFEGQARHVHRVAWFLQTGRWPRFTLDHTCRNRLCFNLRHLEDVRRAENSRRSWFNRRHP